MKLNREYTCSDLCKVLDAKCENSNDNIFNQISTLTQPLKDSLGFVSTKEISQDISKFSGLIVPNDFKTDIKTSVPLFKTENVMHSLSNLLSNSQLTLHYSSSDIFHNVTIGSNVSIGKNCIIYPGVFINHNTVIGDNVIIHPNAVIGSDGFGLYKIKDVWKKIPHIGSVIIENNVEIGSSTTIDRGLIDNTILRNNCKIDNLVHIAHNVVIGENTAIAACTGIAGSTSIGKNCTIGGGVGINGHIDICDNVHIHGMTTVTKSIKEKGQYASAMAVDNVRNWRKNQVIFRNLKKNKG